MDVKKIVIVGLDGGTWNIIFPLMEKGVLPTFKYLLENGCWGKLKSTIPPSTAPAWVSFATGRNPGKHGVFDFVKLDKKQSKLKIITTEDIKTQTFYEYLDLKGLKTILINIPMLYPLNLKNSIQVADMLANDSDNLIIPTEIRNKYEKLLRKYKVYTEYTGDDIQFLTEIQNIEKNRFKLAKELFLKEDWDLFNIVFSGTDWISHRYFKIFNSNINNKLKNEILNFYKQLDDYLHFFKNNLPKNGFLFIISDHGFTETKSWFFINEYLKKHGLIKCEDIIDKDKKSHKVSAKTIKVPSSIFKLFYKLIKTPILNKISIQTYNKFKKICGIKVERELMKIDYSKSKAYCPTSQYGVYVNGINKKFVVNLLKNASYNGEKIIDKIWYKEEIYSGQFINSMPDLIFLPKKNIVVRSSLSGIIFLDNVWLKGHHDINGIFIAYGDEIKKNKKIENAKILDLAPTVLYLFKLPIPKDMDGKVLNDIFIEKSFDPIYVDDNYYSSEKEFLKSKIKRIKSKSKFL